MGKCGIYGLRNKTNGRWYVGMSVNIQQRWSKYKRLRCEKQPKLFTVLSEVGFTSFEPVVLEECSFDQLREREIYWMREKNSIADGYNMVESGTPVTDDMRKKISKSLTGRKYSSTHKSNMSLAHTGIPRTEETKKNIANARRGVSTITEAGRQRIREANARRYAITK